MRYINKFKISLKANLKNRLIGIIFFVNYCPAMHSLTKLKTLLFKLGRVRRNLQQKINYTFNKNPKAGKPDNHFLKRERIVKMKNKLACDTLIETGTFYGQMTYAMSKVFEHVISIEISNELARNNQDQFKSCPNITILNGDSAELLAHAIKISTGKILFWLDGHYSGEGTGLGQEVSPILRELDAIKKSGISDYCIIIDDRRLFENDSEYPDVSDLESKLFEVSPDFEIQTDHDAFIFGKF